MNDITATVLHTTTQLGVGIVAGGVLDAFFPAAAADKTDTPIEQAQVAAEAVGQLIINGLLTAALFKTLQALSRNGASDPTAGFAFTLAAIESQPQLRKKIGLLAKHVASTVSSVAAGADYKRAGGRVVPDDRIAKQDVEAPRTKA